MTNLDYGLLLFLFLGVALTMGGWKVTFTKEGLEWMYKHGIWKEKDIFFTEKGGRRFDRITASGFFILGIILTIGSLALLLIEIFVTPYGI